MPSISPATPRRARITALARFRVVAPLLALGSVALLAAAAHAPEWRIFDRMLLLETTSETSAGVSLGDLDRDGDLDIVLAKGRHWPLQDLVLHNDGKGHFATVPLAPTPDRTYSAALADLNGDGILDIVASNDRPDRKLVYLGDATGSYTPAGTFGDSTWSTRYVTLADLNGDARPDIIVANRSGNAARLQPSFICLNDGAAHFPSCTPLATRSATIIVASDLDGDGRIDLFVPHRDGGQSLVFWNDGTGRFMEPPLPVGPSAVQVRAAAAGDIDGDGRMDLVFGDLRTNRVLLLPNAGGRTFRDAALISADSIAAGAIAIADLNKDAAADIVVGAAEGPGTIFFNAGKETPMRFESARWNDGKGTVYGVAIGDLDGDSWPDLAVARSEAPNAVWFSRAGRRP